MAEIHKAGWAFMHGKITTIQSPTGPGDTGLGLKLSAKGRQGNFLPCQPCLISITTNKNPSGWLGFHGKITTAKSPTGPGDTGTISNYRQRAGRAIR